MIRTHPISVLKLLLYEGIFANVNNFFLDSSQLIFSQTLPVMFINMFVLGIHPLFTNFTKMVFIKVPDKFFS